MLDFSNTSDDRSLWRAKHKNQGRDDAWIEIRRSIGGSDLLLFVARDGWEHKHEGRHATGWAHGPKGWGFGTLGLNVRMSVNGPLMLTFAEFAEIQAAVEAAREILFSA